MTSISVSPVQAEIRAFLKLAIPLVSAQIAQSATGFVDTVMMGHLGWKALAAGGLASFTFQVFLNVLGGVVMGVSPLVAQAFSAGRKTRIEQVTQQGLWLTVGLSIATMWIIAHMDVLMLQLGQVPETVTLASSYLNVMLWGLFPAVGFAMLRGVVSGLSQARPIMFIVMGGTLFNIAGNYVLGFGKFGFPRMELAGLALASTLSWWGMFLVLIVYLFKHPQLRIYRFQKWYQLRLNLLRELLVIGVPIGVSITFEYGLVLIMTYLMGILGTDVLAAHQIALQTGMIVFMIPLGMSFATTARVGQWLGWQNLEGIRRAGFVSSGIVIGATIVVAIALLAFRQQVVGLYVDIRNPENAKLLQLVIPMLSVVAIGHVFDGLQKTALGALYGLQDTRIPVLLGILSFLGVGLVSGYVLGFTVGLGGVGLWVGYYLGSLMAATVYVWRFGNLISRKMGTD
ncbi:MATE family efflux transporter [Gloeocapsopsis sp. IPPAS B-1203]|uniref:MATE family efflux transporter n=1 Tax=Gloeocapsopsis sp. IPPAS B-1203 TaxID=2049454 RepID=UPI000C1A61EE|nr:MATE family efflux transporter [Gloeocapsopsis sp. IPPAS B-1203]PIG92965.1 MATE family efflux transporter [Gloeocapsopsis sp. IPPAS B-1203]